MASATPHQILSDEEVHAVFDSIHSDTEPPPHLKFQVVPINPEGNNISPPQLNFQDGLYLLCDIHSPDFPEQLLTFVGEEPPPATFRWNAGTWRKRYDAFRLRHCYRVRRQNNTRERMNGMSGNMWTKVVNGNENLQYRLLHVYPDTSVKANKPSSKAALGKSITKKSTRLSIRTSETRRAKVEPTKRPERNTTRRISSSSPTVTPSSHRVLSDEDVRAVFDSVHHNRKPPPHLTYQVISVNSGKVTPPRLEFQDGLYVLCDIHDPRTPKHLRALVGKEPPSATCRWNISGPNRPSPSKFLEKRHCYCIPRNGAYDKCGIQWAEVVDGKEDLQYRLLHIFPNEPAVRSDSKKRAPTGLVARTEEEGCEVCGREDNLDSLMECSNCEGRYCHTFCLGLTELPEGDWFCKLCMPRKPATAVRGNRKRLAQGSVHPKHPKKNKGRPLAKGTQSMALSSASRGKQPTKEMGSVNPRGRERLQRRVVSPLEMEMHQEETYRFEKSESSSISNGHSAVVSNETAESLALTPVHYKLTRSHKDPTRDDNADNLENNLGFLIMDSRNATFADVRAAIQDEVDPAALPGNAWKFAMPSLGAISRKQEQILGPVASFIEKAFENRLGDGSAQSPFQLSLLLM